MALHVLRVLIYFKLTLKVQFFLSSSQMKFMLRQTLGHESLEFSNHVCKFSKPFMFFFSQYPLLKTILLEVLYVEH